MRINKYVAGATGLSRRKADKYIAAGRVYINNKQAVLGDSVNLLDKVYLDKKPLTLDSSTILIMLNKPVGYVCSRKGQGAQTIYDLLPPIYRSLKPVGRLDKDSTGLILLTNNGDLANRLAHPKYSKTKQYIVGLNKKINDTDMEKIKNGVRLEDGLSKFHVSHLRGEDNLLVKLSEGRNRQIRRTFGALGYKVTSLHRKTIEQYTLGALSSGEFKEVRIRP